MAAMLAAEEELGLRRRRYEIGYALAPKKEKSFIQSSLLELAASRGINLVRIDLSLSLASQGPFDLLLHKLNDSEWKHQLREFAIRYPSTPIVDPPEAIERLHNRLSMLQVVSELPHSASSSQTFGIPNQVVVYEVAAFSDPSSLSALSSLGFPIIAKPLVADGSAKSHKMALIFNREGLLNQKPPIVLQEFVNHGGVIFKVYVVGDYVQCVRRRSLPDVSRNFVPEAAAEQGSLAFSQVSNVTNHGNISSDEDLKNTELPPVSLLNEIASGLRQALGLHLFNFDMIRDVKAGNHYLIIDINYFPGYAKMPSYEQALTDFFCKILKENEEKNNNNKAMRCYLNDNNHASCSVVSNGGGISENAG